SAWLLARVTAWTPSCASRSAATGGARKKNGLRGSGKRSPRSETQHSRLRTKRSAPEAASATPRSKSGADGSRTSRSRTLRPSIVSPASASVIVAGRSISASRADARLAGVHAPEKAEVVDPGVDQLAGAAVLEHRVLVPDLLHVVQLPLGAQVVAHVDRRRSSAGPGQLGGDRGKGPACDAHPVHQLSGTRASPRLTPHPFELAPASHAHHPA